MWGGETEREIEREMRRYLAVHAGITRWTDASVGVDQIDALASIATWTRSTFVNVNGTSGTRVSCCTCAVEVVH